MNHNLLAKPTAIQFWESPKFAGMGVLVLVFLVGALAGALAMNLGAHNVLHPHPFWDNSGRDRIPEKRD